MNEWHCFAWIHQVTNTFFPGLKTKKRFFILLLVLYGHSFVLQKMMCWTPNAQYLRMWPNLDIESLQIYLVKEKSFWSRMKPYSNITDLLTGKRPCEDNMQRQPYVVTASAETGVMQLQAEECQKLPSKPPNLVSGKEDFCRFQ